MVRMPGTDLARVDPITALQVAFLLTVLIGLTVVLIEVL